ncbi:MAG: energy transducer TonB [Gemmatimonadota bacterium]|nr:energy transducer TonB [Gemmatimonadota bacterium]
MLLTIALMGAASCVSSTKRFYVPTAGEERISPDDLRDRADRVLKVECPRLLAGKSLTTGEADLDVEVTPSGSVTRASVTKSSGDVRVDDIFGALAAQLQFPALRDAHESIIQSRIGIGFSCAPGIAVVTLQMK